MLVPSVFAFDALVLVAGADSATGGPCGEDEPRTRWALTFNASWMSFSGNPSARIRSAFCSGELPAAREDAAADSEEPVESDSFPIFPVSFASPAVTQ